MSYLPPTRLCVWIQIWWPSLPRLSYVLHSQLGGGGRGGEVQQGKKSVSRKVLLFVFLFSVTRENYGKLEGSKVQDKIPAVRKRRILNFVGNRDLEVFIKISTNAHLSL